jgi:hypothetical protein
MSASTEINEMTNPFKQTADTNSCTRVTSGYGSKKKNAKWWDRLLSPRFLVNLSLVAMFFGGAVMNFFFQPLVAAHAAWAMAPGWQREISFYNVTMIAVILFVRHQYKDLDDSIMKGLCILGLLVGTNHLIAAVQDPRPGDWIHWVGIGINFLLPALYLFGKFLRWRASAAEASAH